LGNYAKIFKVIFAIKSKTILWKSSQNRLKIVK
jgi:hypothetical protein